MKKLIYLFLFVSFVSFSQGYDRTKYKTARKTSNQAYKKLLNEDYYGAIALYNKVIESYGAIFQLQKAYENRGKAKFELEDYKGAAADFTECIKLEKTENPILFNLPYPADIKQTNLMIVGEAEDIVEFYLKRGYSKYKLGDKKGACEDARKVQEFRNEFPNEIDITGFLSQYSVAQRHLDLIESACKTVDLAQEICEQPALDFERVERGEITAETIATCANFWGMRGQAALKISNYRGALEFFTKAMDYKVDFELAYVGRGQAKFYLKDYYGAIGDYTKAIDIYIANDKYNSPYLSNAYFYRGYSKGMLEDSNGACKDILRAKELGFKHEKMQSTIDIVCK